MKVTFVFLQLTLGYNGLLNEIDMQLGKQCLVISCRNIVSKVQHLGISSLLNIQLQENKLSMVPSCSRFSFVNGRCCAGCEVSVLTAWAGYEPMRLCKGNYRIPQLRSLNYELHGRI